MLARATFTLVPPQGFDEFMNVVLVDAEEIDAKTGGRTKLGRTLLKGENITLIMKASAPGAIGVPASSSSSSSAAAGAEAST